MSPALDGRTPPEQLADLELLAILKQKPADGCGRCFRCYCAQELEHRRQQQIEGYRTKGGHFRTRPKH